jgi:hypothetical protein
MRDPRILVTKVQLLSQSTHTHRLLHTLAGSEHAKAAADAFTVANSFKRLFPRPLPT